MGRGSLWRTQDAAQATQRGSPPPPAGLLSTASQTFGGTRLTLLRGGPELQAGLRAAASLLSPAAQRSHVLSVHPEQGVPSEQEVCVGLAPRHSLPDCQDAPSKPLVSCLCVWGGLNTGCQGTRESGRKTEPAEAPWLLC